MMQFLSQITGKQHLTELMKGEQQDALLNSAGSAEGSIKQTKEGSVFANALKKLLGLNNLSSDAPEEHPGTKVKGEEGKTIKDLTALFFPDRPTNQNGSGNELQGDSVENLLVDSRKKGQNTAKGREAGPLKGAVSTEAVKADPGKEVPKLVQHLHTEAHLNKLHKKETVLTGKPRISKYNYLLPDQGIQQAASLAKESGQQRNPISVPGKNFIQQLVPEQSGVSKAELAVLKKLKVKQEIAKANKPETSGKKSVVDTGKGKSINVNTKETLSFSNTDKNLRHLSNHPGKSLKFAQKAKKILENGGEQKEDGLPVNKRSAPTMIQTNNSTGQKNSHLHVKNYLDFQQNGEFKLNNQPSLKITDADRKQLDFNFEQGAEESGDQSKSGQDLKLNTTLHQINSVAGRRTMSVQVAQSIQRGLVQGSLKGQNMEQWQNHRFVFDDGNTLSVSIRQADGGIQLQLGTANSELNRLIQQNLNEIHRHLQEQLNVKIDLEMQNFGGESSENSTDNNGRVSNTGSTETTQESGVEEGSRKRTRYLGFNQKEWTA